MKLIEQAFSFGATDLEACFYAGISKDALYDYQVKNPEFTERKEGLKNNLKLIAKNVLGKSIEGGNETDAKWYLERKCKDEFSLRNEHTGAEGKDLNFTINKVIHDARDNDKDS